MKKTVLQGFSFILFCLVLSICLWGCKDTGQTDTASLLEQCKIYLDDSNWSEAIDTCTEAGGDDGYHYAAQAYMGQGGLSLLNLIKSITNAADSADSASSIFSFIPEPEYKSSFKTALYFLMGPNITNKSQTVYLEGLLVSSILVFTELQDVFKLAAVNGAFTTCDKDVTDDADPAKCGFTIDVSGDSPPTLIFTGIGSTFYENLCCNLDAAACTSVFSTTDITPSPDVSADYNVAIDSCNIEARSVLQYNKNAFDSFFVTDAFKDGLGNNVLSPLDFYTQFDSGDRLNVSGDEIPLCKESAFADVTTDDAKLYDCEIIGAVFDPGSELF